MRTKSITLMFLVPYLKKTEIFFMPSEARGACQQGRFRDGFYFRLALSQTGADTAVNLGKVPDFRGKAHYSLLFGGEAQALRTQTAAFR